MNTNSREWGNRGFGFMGRHPMLSFHRDISYGAQRLPIPVHLRSFAFIRG